MIRDAIATALAVAATAVAYLIGVSDSGCLEDEVRMYDGECVPLDDITEAAVDLYIEANMQAARR